MKQFNGIHPKKTITIRKAANGRKRRFIKINNKWIIYSRYLVEKHVRPLKPGEIVWHDDNNILNDSLDNLKIMKTGEGNISIYNGRRTIVYNCRRIYYSRWLFEKHVRPLKPGEIVHHKDEDTLNDCIENYEIKTQSKHMIDHNTGKKFSKERCRNISKSKLGKKQSKKCRIKIMKAKGILTEFKAKKIRHEYFWIKTTTAYKLSKIYNVSRSTINSVLQGYTWNPDNLSKEELIKKSKKLRQPTGRSK